MPVGVGRPYAPVANKPSDNVPQMPHTRCTGTAPIGSSMRRYSSASVAQITSHARRPGQ